MSCPLSIPGKPSWHPALCGWDSRLCQSRTSPPPNAEWCLSLGPASSPVIFLWWYLVLPTKLRLWQRTETTSSSLVQLRFHINKLKCILTVCKVNLPAFRRRLWRLLFRHLAVMSRVSMRTHPFWDRLWGFRARVCLQGLTASGPGLPKHECEDQAEPLMKFSLVLCKITKMRSRKSCFP